MKYFAVFGSISAKVDVLIHEYFGIDLKLAWETVVKDIPELEIKVQAILREIK